MQIGRQDEERLEGVYADYLARGGKIHRVGPGKADAPLKPRLTIADILEQELIDGGAPRIACWCWRDKRELPVSRAT